MQIESVIHKIQELREGHNREAMQEILAELKELRKVLAQEAEDAGAVPSEVPSHVIQSSNKQQYRIDHLTQSYRRLLEEGEKEKEGLKKEIDRLNYRIEFLRKSVKPE